MASHLVLKVTLDKKIIEVLATGNTPGEARIKAREFSDQGFLTRVVPVDSNEGDELSYMYNQVLEKRELGFVRERGVVPNGNAFIYRRKGGCRTISNAIYPTDRE